jgi:hypothetical protein
MSTPAPLGPNDFLSSHHTLDERLDAAFRRYEAAFAATGSPDLVPARMDLSLLLWPDQEEPPQEVCQQLAIDAAELLRQTPPLA